MDFMRFSMLLVICCTLVPPLSGSSWRTQPCSKNQKMSDDLKKAGVFQANVNRYVAIFHRHQIDQLSLSRLVLPVELEKIGITVFSDRLKIRRYFGSDTNDCTRIKTPCFHRGECRDGFKCFNCLCTGNYYGTRCQTKCPCINNGKCRTVITGFECECPPGFGGALCQKQWLTEDRFMVLEEKVRTLVKKLNETQTILKHSERELEGQRKLLENVPAQHNGTGWTLVRVNKIFNQLEKFNLHRKTPTYIQKMPISFPKNTKAILISIYLNFWNTGGHAYMDFVTYQDGNERLGKVAVVNTHYNIYANTFYYELMLPWDTKLPNQIVFKITNSYNTGGPNNWYRVRLVGYITA